MRFLKKNGYLQMVALAASVVGSCYAVEPSYDGLPAHLQLGKNTFFRLGLGKKFVPQWPGGYRRCPIVSDKELDAMVLEDEESRDLMRRGFLGLYRGLSDMVFHEIGDAVNLEVIPTYLLGEIRLIAQTETLRWAHARLQGRYIRGFDAILQLGNRYIDSPDAHERKNYVRSQARIVAQIKEQFENKGYIVNENLAFPFTKMDLIFEEERQLFELYGNVRHLNFCKAMLEDQFTITYQNLILKQLKLLHEAKKKLTLELKASFKQQLEAEAQCVGHKACLHGSVQNVLFGAESPEDFAQRLATAANRAEEQIVNHQEIFEKEGEAFKKARFYNFWMYVNEGVGYLAAKRARLHASGLRQEEKRVYVQALDAIERRWEEESDRRRKELRKFFKDEADYLAHFYALQDCLLGKVTQSEVDDCKLSLKDLNGKEFAFAKAKLEELSTKFFKVGEVTYNAIEGQRTKAETHAESRPVENEGAPIYRYRSWDFLDRLKKQWSFLEENQMSHYWVPNREDLLSLDRANALVAARQPVQEGSRPVQLAAYEVRARDLHRPAVTEAQSDWDQANEIMTKWNSDFRKRIHLDTTIAKKQISRLLLAVIDLDIIKNRDHQLNRNDLGNEYEKRRTEMIEFFKKVNKTENDANREKMFKEDSLDFVRVISNLGTAIVLFEEWKIPHHAKEEIDVAMQRAEVPFTKKAYIQKEQVLVHSMKVALQSDYNKQMRDPQKRLLGSGFWMEWNILNQLLNERVQWLAYQSTLEDWNALRRETVDAIQSNSARFAADPVAGLQAAVQSLQNRKNNVLINAALSKKVTVLFGWWSSTPVYPYPSKDPSTADEVRRCNEALKTLIDVENKEFERLSGEKISGLKECHSREDSHYQAVTRTVDRQTREQIENLRSIYQDPKARPHLLYRFFWGWHGYFGGKSAEG